MAVGRWREFPDYRVETRGKGHAKLVFTNRGTVPLTIMSDIREKRGNGDAELILTT